MMQARFIVLLPAFAFLAGCADAGRILASGPADAAVGAPAPVYRSAFDGIEPVKDEAPIPWQAANEEMRRLGGHVGHSEAERDPHAAHRTSGGAPEAPATDRTSGQPAGHKH